MGDQTLYRGNQLKEQRELPFDFEEAVLSHKERARIQRGDVAFNPFQTASKALVVEEFRISELSARIRTINNARDSMAVLPDGTPLTEVTMYGRRGEVYLLGPFSAVKRVMAGEVPSKSALHQLIKDARKSLDHTISTLKHRLVHFDGGSHVKLTFTDCTGGRSGDFREEPLIHSGHTFMIESCAKDIAAMKDELPSLEEAIRRWKWWGPWSSQAKEVADRIETVITRRDELIKALLEQMVAGSHSSANDKVQQAPSLIRDAWDVIRWISTEVSKLEGYLSQLDNQDRLHNVYLGGELTQIWKTDIPSIRMSLSNYAELNDEMRAFEEDVSQWQRIGAPAGDRQAEFSNRVARAQQAFHNERAAFWKDILQPDQSRIRTHKEIVS